MCAPPAGNTGNNWNGETANTLDTPKTLDTRNTVDSPDILDIRGKLAAVSALNAIGYVP
jgi:hypothetical protein